MYAVKAEGFLNALKSEVNLMTDMVRKELNSDQLHCTEFPLTRDYLNVTDSLFRRFYIPTNSNGSDS
jgi:hypothetical protein